MSPIQPYFGRQPITRSQTNRPAQHSLRAAVMWGQPFRAAAAFPGGAPGGSPLHRHRLRLRRGLHRQQLKKCLRGAAKFFSLAVNDAERAH